MPQWSTTNIGKDFSTSNYYSGNVTNNLPAVIPGSGCVRRMAAAGHYSANIRRTYAAL